MKRIIPIILTFLLLLSVAVSAETVVPDAGTPETVLSDAEQTAFENYPELRIMVKGARYPFSYYEDGEYKGIYPDYLNNLSELSGIKFVYIPYESTEQLEEYFTLGMTDGLDCAYGEWQGLYRVTAPFTTVEYNIITKKGNEVSTDTPYKVTVYESDVQIKNYIAENYPNWEIITCKSITDGIGKVNRGTADIALVSAVDLQTNVSLLRYKKVEVYDEFSIYVPISLAISAVSCPESMVSLLNKYIVCDPMKYNEDFTRNYILNKTYVPSTVEFLAAHKIIMLIIFLLLVAAGILIITHCTSLKRMAATDPLTGLWNREKFVKESKKRLKDNRDKDFLLAVIDVERFKIVNDRFGIDVGNQTIIKIGSSIKKIFHKCGLFAHNTGDEFFVLVQDSPDNRQKLEEASNLDIKINNTTHYKLPIKVGVCPVTYTEVERSNLTAYIDRAKIAKAQMKGHQDKKINYFTQKMDDKLNKENDLETIMRKSLKNHEFLVYYQPKYNLNTNKIIGAEALVRWQHPTKGLISPGDFIPLFEKNGFIVDVDFYVYECVMQMLSNRIKRKKRVVPVSMNVSRCHLNSPTFTSQLEELADKYNIPKEVIEMEITESIFSDEDRAAIKLMYDLKKRNFTLSMDDFGSGYSSLNLLRELPIDTLKIDKGFLDTTDDSARSRVIVEEIISMATKINIKTICEGVETEQQRDFLKQAGCEMAQGFFYARPMPQADFEELLDNEK
jgi:diguanylate cyclase (GGDEF)-like protein